MRIGMALCVAVIVLPACGERGSSADSTTTTTWPFPTAVLPVPDLETVDPPWVRAAVSGDHVVVITRDSAGIVAAGVREVGAVGPFEPLPPLSPNLDYALGVLDVGDGFAVVGGRCTARGAPPEADCERYQSIITFLSETGDLRATRYDEPSDNYSDFTTTGHGTVLASAGPLLVSVDDARPLPDVGVWACGMGEGGPVVDVVDTPSDPEQPEDTPGVLQPMIFNGAWHEAGPPMPVGDEQGRHRGDLPYCATRVVVIAGHVFSGPEGFTDFPALGDDYRDTLVGRTASGELLQRRPTGLVLLAAHGNETVLVDHPVDGAFLSSDGTQVIVWAKRKLTVLDL